MIDDEQNQERHEERNENEDKENMGSVLVVS